MTARRSGLQVDDADDAMQEWQEMRLLRQEVRTADSRDGRSFVVWDKLAKKWGMHLPQLAT